MLNQPSHSATGPRVRVDRDRWRQAVAAAGYPSGAAFARAINVNRTTLSLIVHGHRHPSERFIARALRQLGAGFDAVFYVADE